MLHISVRLFCYQEMIMCLIMANIFFRSYLEGHNGSTYEVSCNTVMPLRLSSPFSVPPWSQWQLPFFSSHVLPFVLGLPSELLRVWLYGRLSVQL